MAQIKGGENGTFPKQHFVINFKTNQYNMMNLMINRGTLLFALLITLSSCSKAPYLPYHSTAGIPHDTRMVQTDMRMIRLENPSEEEDNVQEERSYAVIASVDNDRVPYILIAPAKALSTGVEREFWDYNISYSTTISPDKAQDLLASLNTIIQHWDRTGPGNDGFFFEFTHTPEHEIFRQSEHVTARHPTVRINFNITEEGSVGTLAIGEGDLKYVYKFEELQQVQDFRDLLITGLSELENMLAPI